MADYSILIANSTKEINDISFSIPANPGKTYKVKIESPLGSYGIWYYDAKTVALRYTISFKVLFLTKIKITVSLFDGSEAQEKTYTPLVGQYSRTENIVDPKKTQLERFETIALVMPAVIIGIASKYELKKVVRATQTVEYIFTWVPVGLAALGLILGTTESAPPLAEVTTKYNITSSTIYITATTKFEDGTTKSVSNQKSILGF